MKSISDVFDDRYRGNYFLRLSHLSGIHSIFVPTIERVLIILYMGNAKLSFTFRRLAGNLIFMYAFSK